MKHILYCCFLATVIVVFSYLNTHHFVEEFTPKIRQMYRPYIRNTRITGENFYNKTNSNVSNLLRKIGII